MTDRTDTPRRKFRRRAEARPDEVLDAALDIFIAKGFAAARVEDIARAAGLSKGAVYLYFPSKEAILEAMVKRAIVPVVDNAAALARAGDDDPVAVLKALIRLVGAYLSEPRAAAIPRLVLAEAGNFPHLAAMYRREVIDRAIAMLTALFARGVAAGAFRPVDPELVIRSVVGPILINVLMTDVFGFERPGADRFTESHLDILLNGVLAGREAPR